MTSKRPSSQRLSTRLEHIWVLLNGEIEMGHLTDPFVIDLVNDLHGCTHDVAALERVLADKQAAAAAEGDNVIPLDARRAPATAAVDAQSDHSGGAA